MNTPAIDVRDLRTHYRLGVAGLTLAALTACGGGDSIAPGNEEPPPQADGIVRRDHAAFQVTLDLLQLVAVHAQVKGRRRLGGIAPGTQQGRHDGQAHGPCQRGADDPEHVSPFVRTHLLGCFGPLGKRQPVAFGLDPRNCGV